MTRCRTGCGRDLTGRVEKMKKTKEKFTIKITDQGLVIIGADHGEEKRLYFTAVEALMLLDILRNEEPKLKQMKSEQSSFITGIEKCRVESLSLTFIFPKIRFCPIDMTHFL